MQDIEGNVHTNSVKFLHRIADSLNESIPSYLTLKSYYLVKSCLNEIKGSTYLPAKLSNEKFCCQRCRVYRTDVECIPTIQPAKKPNRFTKRLLRKQTANANLTVYQQKALKHLHNINCNQRVLQCPVCKNKSVTYMKKPLKVNPKVEQKLEVQTSKRKKRKKDKFAGLNAAAVLAATPHKAQQRSAKAKTPNTSVNQSTEKVSLKTKMKQRGKLNDLLKKKDGSKPNALKEFLKTI